ncbi:hypothetical protein B0T24DRAFT_670434 [Lasiosphaeria ovina]|uniref:BHLH domain-containing protein n=1 Tax=Lasiosphaeria ovina TaxID=92902 RepID=A0AAE0JV64_9PEZI|nr:hypothetical protein B0T24DRAFT_670434 [Lasiosphaeria ovina]
MTMSNQDDNQRLAEEEARFAAKERRKMIKDALFEYRRQQTIRVGLERLSAVIPGAEGKAHSERVVIKHTIDYIREELKEREARLRELDKTVDQELVETEDWELDEVVDPALKTAW